MEETAAVLKTLPLFGALSDEALRAVAARTVVRTIPKGRLLFRRGAPAKGMYVVVEGAVHVYRASAQGTEQTLHVRGPRQPLAEVPLFDGGPYPASARAEVESRLLFLSGDAFEWLYRTYPEIADAVIRELGRRLRRMVTLVDKISLRDVPARVAMTLLEYAEKAGPLANGAEFAMPRTQGELATELATARESIARALARMRGEGAIEQKGRRVKIRDLALLEGMIEHG